MSQTVDYTRHLYGEWGVSFNLTTGYKYDGSPLGNGSYNPLTGSLNSLFCSVLVGLLRQGRGTLTVRETTY